LQCLRQHLQLRSHWDYDEAGHSGPANWGSLAEEFATCGTGKEQSPINFISGTAASADLTDLETPEFNP